MRKLFFFYFLVTLSLLSFSCSEDDVKVDTSLSLSSNELTFPSNSGSKLIDLNCNTEWSISGGQEWLAVDPLSGSGSSNATSVAVTVQANITPETRTAVLVVSAGDLTEEISISQAGSEMLALEQDLFEFDDQGGNFTVTLQTTVDYEINITSDWINQNSTKAVSNVEETFSVASNPSIFSREGIIVFSFGELKDTLFVSQTGMDYSIEADMTGVESDAPTLAAKMALGWNLGNSMEVPDGETAWGNPKTTQQLIDSVYAEGFNAVRIPCAWDSYIEDDETYKIKDSWLARVKEVVDYCYTNDMYVILNIHWDGGWLEEHPVYSAQEEVNEKQEALWTQIAIYFRNYDEHLLFAGTNEVRADYGTPSTENIEVQESYNQTFVDAVRATGGKNAYRNLVVQTYNTNISHGINYFTLPEDEVQDRLMVEVHYYDPWDFCGQTDGDFKTQWGEPYTDVSSWGQEEHLYDQFDQLKNQFVDNGIPVILGEYGALLRTSLNGDAYTKHVESRNYYLETVTSEAVANGVTPFYWDNGYTGDNSFGLFDRSTGEPVHEGAIQALKDGAGVN